MIEKDLSSIRLIALDLDDTTLRSDASLSEGTELAIKTAIDCGICVVIASGRAYSSLPRSVTQINGIDYAVCSNGAAVHTVADGKRLFGFTLSPESVRQILAIFEGELFEAFVEGRPYCDSCYYDAPLRYGCSPAYVDYVRTTRQPVADMRKFMLDNISSLDSVDVLCQSPERKTALWERTLMLNNVFVTSSSPRLIEISDARAGKGKSLIRLAELLGIAPEDIAAFGNGDNDAEMLKLSGLGVAVCNASDECKAAADIVCKSNDEDGVAKTIEKIINSKYKKENA